MNEMIDVKAAELIWPALEFMAHMADVNPSDGKIVRVHAGWVDFDVITFVRDGATHKLESCGVPLPVSTQRARVAAKLGDVVQVPAWLLEAGA